MSETRELLRPAVEGFEPMPDAFERVLDRRDRKQRNRRVAAGVVGIAIFALAAFGLARLLTSEPEPAVPEPTPAAERQLGRVHGRPSSRPGSTRASVVARQTREDLRGCARWFGPAPRR